MHKTTFALQKATSCEKIVLESGLTVIVCPMPQFRGIHAIYGTGFGSIDRHFIVDGEEVLLPAGVAHFLEHKMFENEDGDAFTLYAKTGASANAYTSFDKTCYVFTAADHIAENLDILLSFVSQPHFTAETVAKEQGIIAQEIKMYEDAPEWRIMFAMLQGLYHTHPVRDDIAGSVESIAEITPDMLYKCTDAFYQAKNMTLCVAGGITARDVLDACSRAKLPTHSHSVERLRDDEPLTVAKPYTELNMDVATPTLGVAFKEAPLTGNTVRGEYIAEVLCDIVAGGMTPLYRRLYDEGLVSGEFSGEVFSMDGCLSILFAGEVTDPDKVRTLLLEEIARLKKEGADEEIFTLSKNAMYGDMVADMENIESVASAQLGAHLRHRTLADEITALASLTIEDVNQALRTMLCEERCATVVIRKKDKE